MEKIRTIIRTYTRDLYENPISKIFIKLGFTPNLVTMLGLFITIFGSLFIYNGEFFIGGIIVAFGTILDSIDGAMARLSGNESVFGNLLDSVIDRYGEATIFLGLLGYYLFNDLDKTAVLLCVISLLCSQLISYIRAKSESLQIENRAGFFTRVERSVILIIFLLFSQPIIALYILAFGTFTGSIWRLIVGLKNAKV